MMTRQNSTFRTKHRLKDEADAEQLKRRQEARKQIERMTDEEQLQSFIGEVWDEL